MASPSARTPPEPTAKPAHSAPATVDALPAAESNGSPAPAFVEPPSTPVKGHGGWLGWLIFAALACAAWYYWPQIAPHLTVIGLGPTEPPKAPPPRPIPVGSATVESRDFPIYLTGLGTITALKTVTVSSRVEGEVTHIEFTEGEMVQEGDLLAEIDPRTYQVQKAQAEGQLARDEATLKAAHLSLDRLQQLREQKIATGQQIDDQRAIVEQYEGVIQADEALIAQAQLQLDYCQILAPIGGRIGLRLVDEGNIVRPDDPQGIAVITQLQPIALVFTIPQDDIVRVQRRRRSEESLIVEAYNRDLSQRLASGKLLAIDNQVDPTNGTVKLKAEFDNSDGILFPNQFVNARLQVEELQNVAVVPTAAVQQGPDGSYVYIITPKETVEPRPVIVAATEGTDAAIESGITPGETVVTSGLDRLYPGANVQTQNGHADRNTGQTTATGD